MVTSSTQSSLTPEGFLPHKPKRYVHHVDTPFGPCWRCKICEQWDHTPVHDIDNINPPSESMLQKRERRIADAIRKFGY